LERTEKEFRNIDEIELQEVDQLLVEVYKKETDYTKAIEANKHRLLSINNVMLDKVFFSLADEVTSSLSFKSISAFMKQNGYSFGKKEYEIFTRRVDKNFTGKVSPTDFKYYLVPPGTFVEQKLASYQENSQRKTGTMFSGISPIKNWNSSPNKNTNQKLYEASPSDENERSFSPPKNREDRTSLNARVSHGQDRKLASPYHEQKFSSSARQGYLSGKKDHHAMFKQPYEGVVNSQGILYNQEIAAINDNLLVQNVPETSYYQKNGQNPLEWRYLDPTYHNYWSYHRDHNRTLSPDYFNKAEGYTFSQSYKQQGANPSKSGGKFVPYFNPTFVDPGSYENLERYPDNPFRYTDHGHYFKNYYAGLRHNYFDKYYNFNPYKPKLNISLSKSEANSTTKSRNSGMKSRNQSNQQSPLGHKGSNNPNAQTYNLNRLQDKDPQEIPVRKTRNLSSDPEVKRYSHQNQEDNAPYHYVVIPDPKSRGGSQTRPSQYQEEGQLPKNAVRIEEQPFVGNNKGNIDQLKGSTANQQSSLLLDDLEPKPYTFVIVNSKNSLK